MSWDISLYTFVDREKNFFYDVGNYTYNVSSMYRVKLGSGLNALNNTCCKDIIPQLAKVVKDMNERPDYYKTLNPKNGWGNYEGALKYITKLYQACKKYPSAFISVG